jgi:hypothetical protein
MALNVMEDQLHINWKMFHQILHEDLEERNIWTKFLPHSLTHKQKEQRVMAYENFIQTCQTSPCFLSCAITGEKSW